ncbi:MAG TPA: indolepyruvate ferredoxin oxidoreductase subunit alpha [Aggregatilinea sp.]|uniref:indolepyruvate ferredoxin oxidoreductase subunit alpha n=1 Tax=Aggregatilinea sp. TaxID=2806333 RepID=UPI002BCB665E|nr:indolepyruvate ferredoxin oxidoreductase subunit alpha [Aggregatilinea sp.]HML23248.1 indolepyruvate ferredoxin oxidoreductase subunit alpha [Aggregatilinea sp.]
MERFVPLGNEALAQGALDAGISGMYAYPGTPSTEIMEYVQRSPDAAARNVHRRWSSNEKTAVEAALGMSYAGKRAMACMKHVGLNVAADPFMNAAVIGVNGGLLIVAADDPSMHSSQNEQDSRVYGRFAQIPVLEPSNQQEAYDAARIGFDLSEKYGVPVLIRMTTRLSHSRANVVRQDPIAENDLNIPANLRQFVLLPGVARKRYADLLDKQPSFEREAEQSPLVRYEDGPDKRLGIIACGIAYNYLMENYPGGCPHPVVKVGQYPAPRRLIADLASACDAVLVLEEGMPVVEEQMRGYPFDEGRVHGRLDGTLPRAGELNPERVAKALGHQIEAAYAVPEVVVDRPPQLCQGCPHADTYRALNTALEPYAKGRVFADIGCYTLGALPPFESINTCVEMGASITMAKGAADAGLTPTVAVIGDSTFSHSGMTGLLDAVQAHAPVTVIILDNETTAMTGGQDSPANGVLEQIVSGLGVAQEHVRVITPLPRQHEVNADVIAQELAYEDVSVIIARRECLETARRRKRGQS